MSAADLKRLNAEHRRALNAYAREHGRTWRSKLNAARLRGDRSIRGDLAHAVNLIGPSGIRAYRVTMENPGRKRVARVLVAATNADGMTWREWAYAAGMSDRSVAAKPAAKVRAWKAGEDPSEYRATAPKRINPRGTPKDADSLYRMERVALDRGESYYGQGPVLYVVTSPDGAQYNVRGVSRSAAMATFRKEAQYGRNGRAHRTARFFGESRRKVANPARKRSTRARRAKPRSKR